MYLPEDSLFIPFFPSMSTFSGRCRLLPWIQVPSTSRLLRAQLSYPIQVHIMLKDNFQTWGKIVTLIQIEKWICVKDFISFMRKPELADIIYIIPVHKSFKKIMKSIKMYGNKRANRGKPGFAMGIRVRENWEQEVIWASTKEDRICRSAKDLWFSQRIAPDNARGRILQRNGVL